MTRKVALWGIGALLLLTGSVLAWPELSKSREVSREVSLDQPKAKTQPAGPAFNLEGTLSFIDQHTRDTLTTLNLEVVDNETDITQGLMWRKQMEENCGMLFLFPDEAPRSFWMKNTYIPLDIIYVNGYQKIVSIARNTEPLTLTSIPSEAPARYVIEVNAGFCLAHAVETGDFMEFRVYSGIK